MEQGLVAFGFIRGGKLRRQALDLLFAPEIDHGVDPRLHELHGAYDLGHALPCDILEGTGFHG
jgi:hypothetical protein